MQYQFDAGQQHSEDTLILDEKQWQAKIDEIEKLMQEINRRNQMQPNKVGRALTGFQKELKRGNEQQIRQIKGALAQLVRRLREVAKTYKKMSAQVADLQKLLAMDTSQDMELERENEEKYFDAHHTESEREMYEEDVEKKKEEEQLEAEEALEELEVESMVAEELEEEAMIEMQQARMAEEEEAKEDEKRPESRPHEKEYTELPKEMLYKKVEEDIQTLAKMPQEIHLMTGQKAKRE